MWPVHWGFHIHTLGPKDWVHFQVHYQEFWLAELCLPANLTFIKRCLISTALSAEATSYTGAFIYIACIKNYFIHVFVTTTDLESKPPLPLIIWNWAEISQKRALPICDGDILNKCAVQMIVYCKTNQWVSISSLSIHLLKQIWLIEMQIKKKHQHLQHQLFVTLMTWFVKNRKISATVPNRQSGWLMCPSSPQRPWADCWPAL